MEIIVCIKQVPDTTDIKIDPETNTLQREGVPSIVNPYDMYAIEESVRIKEKFGGKVTAVSMGPPQSVVVLKEAISLGADEAYLLSDPEFAGADTLATAYTISSAIRKIGKYDIIFCGKQAIDGDTAQVGPGIAELLNLPQVTFVRKIEKIKDGFVVVERLMEEGYQILRAPLPVLFSVVKEINEPRFPTLRGKLKAKNTEVRVWDAKLLNIDTNRIGLKGSPTCVVHIFTPPKRKAGKIFKYDASTSVKCLLSCLKEDGII